MAHCTFRADRSFRIWELPIMPPPGDRPSDIRPLAQRLLDRLGRSSGPQVSLAPDAFDRLRAGRFPGNAREVENRVNRPAAR